MLFDSRVRTRIGVKWPFARCVSGLFSLEMEFSCCVFLWLYYLTEYFSIPMILFFSHFHEIFPPYPSSLLLSLQFQHSHYSGLSCLPSSSCQFIFAFHFIVQKIRAYQFSWYLYHLFYHVSIDIVFLFGKLSGTVLQGLQKSSLISHRD